MSNREELVDLGGEPGEEGEALGAGCGVRCEEEALGAQDVATPILASKPTKEGGAPPCLSYYFLHMQNVRFSVIGNKLPLPRSIEQILSEAEVALKANSGLRLMVALGYGGRYEILQACKSVSSKVKDGLIQLQDIEESLIEQELQRKWTKFPSPDLFIRTGGECRVSNFML
ncbi:unnamed protein product [Ilex paraguariensis]|uniref:Uncharacterized protein n=1 Tax=Ilex paraguariensis TaxID=185542 RepID=A0ABC8UP17_9AQUA